MWSKIMRKRSGWAKLPHTTFVVRARNYVTQRAENCNRFNSSSATFRFKLRSATLVVSLLIENASEQGSISKEPPFPRRFRSRLATNRQSGLLPFSRRTPTSYLASHNFVSLLPRDNINSAVALKPLPYRLGRRRSQSELHGTKRHSQCWREG